MTDGARLREQAYRTDDLSAWPLFGGGYINFGHWAGLPARGPYTERQRVESQRALYTLVLDALDIGVDDRVVEVGCGLGLGTTAAVTVHGAARARGVDRAPEQLERAAAVNGSDLDEHGDRITFLRGAADRLPVEDAWATRLLSVEALQHFDDVPGFVREARRVLAPGGRLAVSTFLSPRAGHAGELARRLATYADGIDLDQPLPELLALLRDAGFADVRAVSLGEHVWEQFDQWIAQVEGLEPWSREWLPCYRDGLVDYYLVTARAPG